MPIRILYLASNPADTQRLNLEAEIRDVHNKMAAARYRDELKLESRWAVRPDDLIQYLLEVKPTIVHFSGHGDKDGIYLDTSNQGATLVPNAGLVRLFQSLKGHVRLIVLNACSTQSLAEALAGVVGCVVGTTRDIGDQAATQFAATFYQVLADGQSVQQAYEVAGAALMLAGDPEHETHQLFHAPAVDPAQLVLVPATALAAPALGAPPSLSAYARTGFIPPELITRSIIKAVAGLVSPADATYAVLEANALRRKTDPEGSIINLAYIGPPDRTPPFVFWADVFQEARKHSPRMVAALFAVVNWQNFPDDAKRDVEALLQYLRNLPPQP